jgi:hypothetical protein
VFDHTATLLNEYDAEGKLVTTESRIVIHGGCVAGDKDTCTSALKNIYLVTVDHRNKQWTLAKVSEMNHFTGRHMAVLLYAKPGPNVRQSQVFIAGGVGEGNLFSAELCDADLLSCTDEGFAASAGRQNGCMVQFVDPETGAARIFMGCGNKSYASAEVFGDGTFTTAGSLTSAREGCRCALAGSKVFIVGGICEAASQFAAQVETFDFATDQFQLLGSMGAGEYRVNHTVTATLDRYVLIAGGSLGPGTACGYDTPSDTAIVIDARGGPGGGPVIKSPPLEMRAGRQRHVATVLADGSILLTGGVQLAIGARGSAEIWVAPP